MSNEVSVSRMSTGEPLSRSSFHIPLASHTYIKKNLMPRYPHLRVETARLKNTTLTDGRIATDKDGNPIKTSVTNPLSITAVVQLSIRFFTERVLGEKSGKGWHQWIAEFDNFVETESGATVDEFAKAQSALLGLMHKDSADLSDTEKAMLELLGLTKSDAKSDAKSDG